jgi:hypothetical protein
MVTRFGHHISDGLLPTQKDAHSLSQSDTPRNRQISMYASYRHTKSAYQTLTMFQTNPIVAAGTDRLQA